MKGYIYTILALAIICGIISSIISEANQGTKKYVNFLMGLIMVITIMLPFKNLTYGISNIKDTVNNFFTNFDTQHLIDKSNTVIINSSKENICKGIKNSILSKYGFDENEVKVSLEIDKSEISAIKITAVYIALSGKAAWFDVSDVSKYMENLVGVRVYVTRK
jgi:6-pyruvoyl-tetrahydropterin synthase